MLVVKEEYFNNIKPKFKALPEEDAKLICKRKEACYLTVKCV